MGRQLWFVLVVAVAASCLAATGRARADDPRPEGEPTLVYVSRIVLVADARDAQKAIAKLAESLGGKLVNASDTAVVVDVPRERYRDFVARLSALGELGSEKLSTSDVTDALTDSAAAAETARKSRDQLGRVTNLAHGTDERLLVERELEAATEEITNGEARQRELSHSADAIHVTIQLTVPPAEAIPSPTLPFPWLGELGLERLRNTEQSAPRPSLVLRSFFDFTSELRLAHMAQTEKLDGVSKSAAAGFSFRALGEANPVGLFGGFDLVLGGSRGFVYGTQLLGGIGMPIGRRFGFGVATGPGFDGITSVMPFGVTAPIELYLTLDLARPVAVSAFVRDGWVFAASARRHGSSHAPFGDELAAGLLLAFGLRDDGSYTGRRFGPQVGFAYREAMDAKIYEIRLGFGAHESDFSESY